jgi:hypothetical protein
MCAEPDNHKVVYITPRFHDAMPRHGACVPDGVHEAWPFFHSSLGDEIHSDTAPTIPANEDEFLEMA